MTGRSTRPHWWPAYIGMGSNLESPASQLRSAENAIAAIPRTRLQAVSPHYRSAPMGPSDQPDFVNAAAAVLTRLDAHRLLTELQAIEIAQGRRRDGSRWGPRTLDLDLLVFSGCRIEDEHLTVPHPGIAERNFVLFPLRDIAPHLRVPGLASVSVLAAEVDASTSSIQRLEG